MITVPHIWGLNDFELQRVALIAPSVEKNSTDDLTLPTTDTFQIYGDADEVIDPDNMRDFAERMGINTTIVEGAGHFFHGRLPELKQLLEKHS